MILLKHKVPCKKLAEYILEEFFLSAEKSQSQPSQETMTAIMMKEKVEARYKISLSDQQIKDSISTALSNGWLQRMTIGNNPSWGITNTGLGVVRSRRAQREKSVWTKVLDFFKEWGKFVLFAVVLLLIILKLFFNFPGLQQWMDMIKDLTNML